MNFIEPLYKKDEVIMVESIMSSGDCWMPVFFQEMSGDDVMVHFATNSTSKRQLHRYTNHRKLNDTDRGGV